MKIREVTKQSKKRAEDTAKNNGGILVSIYAVVQVEDKGRVQSVTHDHLTDVSYIDNKS